MLASFPVSCATKPLFTLLHSHRLTAAS